MGVDGVEEVYCWQVTNPAASDYRIYCRGCVTTFIGTGYTTRPLSATGLGDGLSCDGCETDLSPPGLDEWGTTGSASSAEGERESESEGEGEESAGP